MVGMTSAATCYMCDSVETSREHVPPLCFFPEAKKFGQDLRRNLITVPSCDQHNSQKSKDDEFLRSVILMTPGNNEAGQHQFAWKLLPATSRKPHAYRPFFIDKGTVAQGKGRALQINRDRFNRCIDHLARALFFHAYKRKWKLPIITFSPNFFSGINLDDMVPHQPSMRAIEASRQFLSNEPNRGENPDVFQYRIRYGEDGADEGFACAAIFYGAFEIFLYSSTDLTGSKTPI
jgi:hypothetical protein